jgi:YbbR domain-containing protein
MGEFENSDGANFENSTISSINELNNLDLSVYPNPVVSNATIELNLTKKSNVSMNVVDVLGKLVASNSYNLNSGNNKINLDVNNIENGVYFIELNVNGSTSTKKITVTK